MLTARGVPGGTAAKTFDEAYLEEGSKSKRKPESYKSCCIYGARNLRDIGECDREIAAPRAGDGDRPKSTTLDPMLLTALVEREFT